MTQPTTVPNIQSPSELREHVTAQLQVLQQTAATLLDRHADLYQAAVQATQQARKTDDYREVTRLRLALAEVERQIDRLFVGRML
ncbi:MAG: hypothetical protein KKA73_03405 [Chloroflexi bacterium]|nr:hypothetical protein [Chloroflexota bacterium]